ncbi:MAG: AraC family transcriptional regulator [Muribaculaceae bacterium]|nr:AraC family transcriptional regulator [Muribaculaceae bacterium]
MKGDKTLKYEGLQLPENLTHILEQDFWMLDNINGATLGMLRAPMKFTSTTSIFVRRGECKAEINLQEYTIKAPCVVNIASSEIMQPLLISEDFEGAFAVMSARFVKDFISQIADEKIINYLKQNPVIEIPTHLAGDFEVLCSTLRTLVSDHANKYIYLSVLHTLLAFFFHTAVKCLGNHNRTGASASSHITTRFLRLARDNFKRERFMDFYAKELGITTKHLSRTVKAHTGFTASEWLDRLVILEAKVLLKSSGMTIQQIAEELNFPSQSFFGKYFKNIVGVSPKDFRNAR